MPTISEYKTELRNPIRKQVYKIEWMDKDENIIYESTTDYMDGSISIQLQNGVRRSCNITLTNDDGLYTPDPNGLVFIGKKIKIYSGLNINGTDYFPSESIQGVFNIGNPVIRSESGWSTVTIEGYDNFALLNGTISGSIDSAEYQVDIGTSITNAVTTILSDAGIVKNPFIYTNSYTIYYTLVKEAGNTYADMLIEIANIISWDIFFNVQGQPVFKTPVDEDNEAHVWEFTEDEVSYLSSEHNYNYAEVRNHIIVYGENVNGDLATGEAQDNGIFSPTSVARIGRRTHSIVDNLIIDDTEALARARYELRQAVQAYEFTNIKTYNVDFLKEGDIILIRDSNGAYNADRYLIKQINRTLSFDAEMTIQAWKVRDID